MLDREIILHGILSEVDEMNQLILFNFVEGLLEGMSTNKLDTILSAVIEERHRLQNFVYLSVQEI